MSHAVATAAEARDRLTGEPAVECEQEAAGAAPRRPKRLVIGERACARAIHVPRLEIAVTDLVPSLVGLKIAHVTDIHLRRQGPLSRRVVEIVRCERPDLIAVTGDLIRFPAGPEVGAEFLRRLAPLAPTFVVLGNHEYKPRLTGLPVAEFYRRSGATVLMNESHRFACRGQTLWIVGVDDPYLRRHDLKKAFACVPEGAPALLLAHSPAHGPSYARAGASLTLCGHTHGGQVRLPWVGAVRLHSAAERQFDAGLFTSDELGPGRTDPNPSMVVSRGLGLLGVPVRLLCAPELPIITLVQG